MPNALRLPPPLGFTWQFEHFSPASTARYGSAVAIPAFSASAARNETRAIFTRCFMIVPLLRHAERRREVAAGDAVALAIERVAAQVEHGRPAGARERDAVTVLHERHAREIHDGGARIRARDRDRLGRDRDVVRGAELSVR